MPKVKPLTLDEIADLKRVIDDQHKPFGHFTVTMSEYKADPRAVRERGEREQANYSIVDDDTGKVRMCCVAHTREYPDWDDLGQRLMETIDLGVAAYDGQIAGLRFRIRELESEMKRHEARWPKQSSPRPDGPAGDF